jgi:hypothetical protein
MDNTFIYMHNLINEVIHNGNVNEFGQHLKTIKIKNQPQKCELMNTRHIHQTQHKNKCIPSYNIIL